MKIKINIKQNRNESLLNKNSGGEMITTIVRNTNVYAQT